MGRWRDSVSAVGDGAEVRRTPKGSLTGLLKQSVAGLVGHSQDPSSPQKKRLSWLGRGSRRSPPEEDPGPDPELAIEGSLGGSRGGSQSSTALLPAMPGSTDEEFAVASQLLEGLYGKRLDANKAMHLLSTVPEISWLVECYCMTPAQPGWRKSKTAPGDVPLYADEASGKVYEAMPCIRHYIRMAELALTARNLPEKADSAAMQLHHCVQSLQKELKTVEAAWTGPHEDSESQGEYYHNPSTGVSTWDNPAHCTMFILSVAEQLQDSDAFPQSAGKVARNREEGPATNAKSLRATEDPWTSLDKLEAMSGPSGATQDMDIEAFLGSLSQVQGGDPTSPSGQLPVQLLATSPKGLARRPDSRGGLLGHVPRLDAAKLSEQGTGTSRSPPKKREVPLRPTASSQEPSEPAEPEEDRLRHSAEAMAQAAREPEAAPLPPELPELRVSVAPESQADPAPAPP